MSTTSTAPVSREEMYANAINRAENYPMFGDGLTRPVAVGNIGFYGEGANRRAIINLACKTDRCVGGNLAHEHERPSANAHISQPADWKIKFNTGEYVCALIEDGYVRKLYPAATMQARQITVNSKVVAQTEAAMNTVTDADGNQVDPTTGEVLDKAAVGSDADNDLPF